MVAGEVLDEVGQPGIGFGRHGDGVVSRIGRC
jgi:hypothetical protein